MRALPHTRSCFVCGEANTLGLNLRFETDDKVVRARFVPKVEHAGFKGVVHGGVLATVLDEIMVWACAVRTGRFGYCAEMNVRFIRPARPAEALMAIGELIVNRRDRIYEARGELRSPGGEVLAASTGKYLPLKEAEADAMSADFVGERNWFRAAV